MSDRHGTVMPMLRSDPRVTPTTVLKPRYGPAMNPSAPTPTIAFPPKAYVIPFTPSDAPDSVFSRLCFTAKPPGALTPHDPLWNPMLSAPWNSYSPTPVITALFAVNAVVSTIVWRNVTASGIPNP